MFETEHIQTLPLPSYFCFHFNLDEYSMVAEPPNP